MVRCFVNCPLLVKCCLLGDLAQSEVTVGMKAGSAVTENVVVMCTAAE